jgi:hypothetical protein
LWITIFEHFYFVGEKGEEGAHGTATGASFAKERLKFVSTARIAAWGFWLFCAGHGIA